MNSIEDGIRSLLEDNGITMTELSDGQERVLELFKEGRNVLVIGAAGCGKSKIIKEIKYNNSKEWRKNLYVTATTGIAAYSVNGVTINSFMGIGTGDKDVETLIKKIRRLVGIRERIRMTDILVIDEISMLSAELFEKINIICQVIRKSSAPFGGIQVVLSGDHFQLLPIFNKRESKQDERLIFESDVFKRYFDKRNTIVLKENFRHIDEKYAELLLRLRICEHREEDIALLKTRILKDNELKNTVNLVSSNKKAQDINNINLDKIKGEVKVYKARFTETGEKETCKDLTKELSMQFLQKGINEVRIKKGARVMLIKNLSVDEGLVNGSVGTISAFSERGFPIVDFDNGIKREIEPVEFVIEYGNDKSIGVQIPLMLSWAITCHKSQSLTLDRAIMDLGDAFAEHQVYVALSRVRTLDGLYLKSFDEKKIKVNEKVKAYMKAIE